MDKIFIENLRIKGRHGVDSHERRESQDFLVDISAEIDTKAAAMSDDLADTADYKRFCEIAREAVESNSFYLIERLADTIARKILEDNRLASVEVVVRKPEALESGMAGVRIVRTR